MYRLIIADDHAVVRQGIIQIINNSKEFTVIGEASSGTELLALLEEKACDMVLSDIVMPGIDGLKSLKIIKNKFPHIKVVMLTMHTDKGFFDEAIKSGVDGYALKDDSPEIILTVLDGVIKGHRTFSPKMQTIMANKYLDEGSPIDLLTDRELQIFKLVAKGSTHKEIAEDLEISISTVEFHKKNLKDKLNTKNLADLLNIAHKHDLV